MRILKAILMDLNGRVMGHQVVAVVIGIILIQVKGCIGIIITLRRLDLIEIILVPKVRLELTLTEIGIGDQVNYENYKT